MNKNFPGFENKTLKFLKDLKSNNNREWFNANKDRYLSDVLEPALNFIESLQPGLKKISPHVLAIPKRTGGSLMRIYRDTRFSKDKTPYKTNIGIQLRHEFGKDVHAPGFYIHIEPTESFFVAGIWRPENKVLKQIRDHIVENENVWARISRSKRMSNFEFAGESLKKSPRDFDPEHRFINDLKRKDFIVIDKIPTNILKSDVFAGEVLERMKSVKTFVRFLCEALRLPF